MKFSIITPSYNQGEFIEANILSVERQCVSDFEHIIIDGGSTDNTIEVLKKYPEINWVSQKDNGQSDALNKGFKKATGEIICWVNSDDELANCSLEVVLKYFEENPSKKIVGGALEMIDENGASLGIKSSKRFTLNSLLNLDKMLYQPSIFFKRELFQEVGYLNEQLNYAMDYDFFLRICKLYPIEAVSEVLARYRQYGDTKTQSSPIPMLSEQLKVRKCHGGKIISKVFF